MSHFKREERYIVIKLKRIDEDQLEAVRDTLESYQIPTEQCVVVEHDWPIYEQTWDAVHRLAEGRPQLTEELERAMHRVSVLENDYEGAMHCIAQLEALPLLQFTSVDDELPEEDGVYLCQFDDGEIESFTFTEKEGFGFGIKEEPGFKVVGWCDVQALFKGVPQ